MTTLLTTIIPYIMYLNCLHTHSHTLLYHTIDMGYLRLLHCPQGHITSPQIIPRLDVPTEQEKFPVQRGHTRPLGATGRNGRKSARHFEPTGRRDPPGTDVEVPAKIELISRPPEGHHAYRVCRR